MIKALVTVPGAELAATSDLSEPAQQVEWASRRSGASGPEGYIFRTLERPSHCLVFVTEASLMELVAPSRGRGSEDSGQQALEGLLYRFLAEYLRVSGLTLSAQFLSYLCPCLPCKVTVRT